MYAKLILPLYLALFSLHSSFPFYSLPRAELVKESFRAQM